MCRTSLIPQRLDPLIIDDIRNQGKQGSNCTQKSSLLRYLTVSQSKIVNGNPLVGENSSITFLLENTATGVKLNCSGAGPELTPDGIGSDPYKWWDCAPRTNDVVNTTARFQYNLIIEELTVNETWACLEDPAHTYV
jgi:hypothetical protein